MLKLTRLDHRTVAINPMQIAWVEATPDTMVCMLAGQKLIVLESLDEVVARFVEFYEQVGRTPIVTLAAAAMPHAEGEEK